MGLAMMAVIVSMVVGVVVVVASDFGRTRYNGDGGKDHWPITSMMMMGAGISGGRVIGQTDRGDDMFMAMIERSTAQILDLDALDVIT